MDESAETKTMMFADMCRRASEVAVSRVATRPTVRQSLAVVTAAAAARSKIGRRVGACYVHVGSTADDPRERASYLVDVVEAAEKLGLKVSASPAPVKAGLNVYARVVLEW